jgi:hypothetical protein
MAGAGGLAGAVTGTAGRAGAVGEALRGGIGVASADDHSRGGGSLLDGVAQPATNSSAAIERMTGNLNTRPLCGTAKRTQADFREKGAVTLWFR